MKEIIGAIVILCMLTVGVAFANLTNGHRLYPYTASDLDCHYTINASGNIEYIGCAIPGTLDNATKWQIKKLEYDTDSNVVCIAHANGENGYGHIWDNRTDYTYNTNCF